jgi:hypothetical protein
MPLPSRRKNEDKNKFMARCMGDPNIQKDFKDVKQRVAVCMSKACEDCDYVEAADFQVYFESYGSEEEVDENNFYAPQENEYASSEEVYYEDSEVEDWDVSVAKPGLWDNIRKKKEREGKNYKPAKKGDSDYPDSESWKQAQSRFKYKDPKTGEVFTYERQGVYKKNGRYLVPSNESESSAANDNTSAEEYQGRTVKLNKPFRTPDGPKKFSVYVKNDKGNVVKVNFGDPNMRIKKYLPEHRKSFRARHHCDTDPGPKWKARYWACRSW